MVYYEVKMERWLSGRKRRIANPLYVFAYRGSNPPLSVVIS